MRISDLNQKIDICSKVVNDGPIENLEPTYETLFTVWAKKTQLLGKEAIKVGLEHNTIQVNFICRKRVEINENLFINHNGCIYNILGVNELSEDVNYMLIATVRKQVIA